MNDTTYDIVVVGAGLAGLAAASIAAPGRRVALVDAHQAGGRAVTTERDGFRLNEGPHALYLGGPAVATLHELGIRPTGHPPSRHYFARVGDRVHVLPFSATGMARTRMLGVRGKARLTSFLQKLSSLRAGNYANQSAAEWSRSLELPADAEALLMAMVRVSTYTHAPEELSADAAISQIQRVAANGVIYLDGGWQRLVDALGSVATERGVEVQTGRDCIAVRGEWDDHEIVLPDTTLRARSVIVAVGGPAAAERLLGVDVGWRNQLGPPARAACLDLGLTAPPRRPVLFGIDRPLYLSMHAPPGDLAPAGRTLVSVAKYVPVDDDAAPAEDRHLLEQHAAIAGIQRRDVVMQRFLRHMTVITAIPTYRAGGLPGRPHVAVAHRPGAFVAGDWVGPVGMLADATLASAAAAARAATAHVDGLVRA